MTIYEKMVQAGIKPENHCSDMYVPVNAITKKIVDQYAGKQNVTIFIDNIDHKAWYNIPLSYDPFWNKQNNDTPY